MRSAEPTRAHPSTATIRARCVSGWQVALTLAALTLAAILVLPAAALAQGSIPQGSIRQSSISQGQPASDGSADRYQPVVDTVAGGGSVGDGGPATDARLSLPGGLLVEADGDLIIVDFGNHRIRRIDAETGVITTIAGTGEPNFTGDGGPAAQAGLARPENAALGPDGDIYIVDEYNHRIRRVDVETGIITSIAGNGIKGYSGDGGPALEAALNWPEGIAADRAGNLFIGDTQNRRIRRIDAETGIITTIAGSGEQGITPNGTPAEKGSFLRIARLAVDSEGKVYIADSPAQRIYVVDPETGLMNTFVGTGEDGYGGDGGPAAQAMVSYPEGVFVDRHDNVYWCDVGTHRVRRVDAETGIVTTVAGIGERGFTGDGGPAAAARLWSPGRLAQDAAGNLYIADIGNARVRRVDAEDGTIVTVAGSGDLGDGGAATDSLLAVPGDVAYAPGRLYVADYGNRRVRRVDLATGVITTVAGGGLAHGDGLPATEVELLLPEGIALDADENLYIADNIANKVWRVDAKSGLIHTFAGTGQPGNSGDGGPATAAQLAVPGSVAIGPGGDIYIADFGNRRIRVVDAESGVISSLEGHPILDGLPVVSLAASERGLFWLSAGDPAYYHLSAEELAKQEKSPIRVPLSDNPESYILDVVAAGDELFVADTMAHQILRASLRNGAVKVYAGSGVQGFLGDGGPPGEAAFFQPGGVALGEDGTLFIADSKNHRVRRVRMPRPEKGAR